jgi:hypothetical protein
VPGGRELAHVGADLRHEHLGGAPAYPGDGCEPGERLIFRMEALLDLAADALDAGIQVLDVSEVLGQQESLVRPHAANKRPFQGRQFLAYPSLREGGKRRGIGRSADRNQTLGMTLPNPANALATDSSHVGGDQLTRRLRRA